MTGVPAVLASGSPSSACLAQQSAAAASLAIARKPYAASVHYQRSICKPAVSRVSAEW